LRWIKAQCANVALREQIKGPTGDFVALSVINTEVGMPTRVIAQACRTFFTAKAPEHCTGLGLARVREFTQLTGGAVEIASKVRRQHDYDFCHPSGINVVWVDGVPDTKDRYSSAPAWVVGPGVCRDFAYENRGLPRWCETVKRR
jgi:signal transduction histidine kinase